jgi:hypothetical protein
VLLIEFNTNNLIHKFRMDEDGWQTDLLIVPP